MVRPNCWRTLAYSTADSTQSAAPPTASAASRVRARASADSRAPARMSSSDTRHVLQPDAAGPPGRIEVLGHLDRHPGAIAFQLPARRHPRRSAAARPAPRPTPPRPRRRHAILDLHLAVQTDCRSDAFRRSGPATVGPSARRCPLWRSPTTRSLSGRTGPAPPRGRVLRPPPRARAARSRSRRAPRRCAGQASPVRRCPARTAVAPPPARPAATAPPQRAFCEVRKARATSASSRWSSVSAIPIRALLARLRGPHHRRSAKECT